MGTTSFAHTSHLLLRACASPLHPWGVFASALAGIPDILARSPLHHAAPASRYRCPPSDAVVVAVLVTFCIVVAIVMVRYKYKCLQRCSIRVDACALTCVHCCRLTVVVSFRLSTRRVRPPWRAGVRHREGQGRGPLRALSCGAAFSSHPLCSATLLVSATLLLSATLSTLLSYCFAELRVVLCSSGIPRSPVSPLLWSTPSCPSDNG